MYGHLPAGVDLIGLLYRDVTTFSGVEGDVWLLA